MTFIPIHLNFFGAEFTGTATPVANSVKNGVPYTYNIILNSRFIGMLECTPNGWRWNNRESQQLADALGDYIVKYIE